MEQVHARSRKRTNHPNVPQSGGVRDYRSPDDYSPEYRPRGPKRQRPEASLWGPTSHSNAFSISTNSSPSVIPESTFSNVPTQNDSDTIILQDEFPMFPPGTPLGLQQYPSIYDQLSPQGVAITNNAAGTPATYTVTDGTCSPGSLNRQSLLDPNDCVNQSPDGGSERLFSGPYDFNFGLGNEWQWTELDISHLMFGNSVRFDVSEPQTDMNNNFLAYLDPFTDVQQEDERAAVMSTTTDGLMSRPIKSCVSTPSLTNGIFNSSNIGLPQRTPISTKASSPVVPHTPQLEVFQPSKESPTTSPNLVWHHMTNASESPQRSAGQRPELKSHGCRFEPLKLDVLKHARRMRKVRACWPCRISKVTCSFTDPCTRCSKPSLPPRLCYRAPFTEYGKDFTPDLVYSRLREPAITVFINQNARFTNNVIEVEMMSGPNYPSMRLIVTEFRPLNQEILALNLVTSKEDRDDQCLKFIPSYAPPFGLFGTSAEELRDICLDHIKAVIENERDVSEANQGDISIISWKVFEAVNRYRRSIGRNGNSRLLRKAAMLHAMQYFMSRIISFTKESAEKAIEGLRRPHTLKFAQTISSSLLNLQIKQAMQGPLSGTTNAVLEELEKAISKSKTKTASWADIFCVVLILCMCIEAVQVASDSYAMAALRKDPKCGLDRVVICRALDVRLFKRLTEMFHMAYKTPKASRKGSIGFNPIRIGLVVNKEEGITPQMVELVHEVKRIMATHGDEMAQVAENPAFDPTPDLLTHHMAFRKRNSGRLVSKFLRSFM